LEDIKMPTDFLPAPRRISLSDRITAFLRDEIRAGRWHGELPAEANLARELNISRGTLRRSLTALCREKLLIPGGRGVVHRIALPSNKPSSQGAVVRVLSPQSRLRQTSETHLVFQTMCETLSQSGLRFEFEHHAGVERIRKPGALLKRITDRADTAAWVLFRSTYEIQSWFEQSGVPCVVLGGIYPGINLPHAEFELEYTARHAATLFAKRQHKRMAFLVSDSPTAGDDSCARAFIAAGAEAGCHAEIARYDATLEGLCRTLDSLLLAKPAPTAFFVAFADHVAATIGHLTRRGWSVPEDAAVISRMDGRLLAESIPTIARYRLDAEKLGRGLAELIRSVTDPEIKTSQNACIVMPRYVDGESAGQETPA
jgi:hypothetical protein